MMKRNVSLGLLGLGIVLAAGACSKNGNGSGNRDGDGGASSGGESDGRTPLDAIDGEGAAKVDVQTFDGDDDCPAWSPGERPTAELPPEHTNEYEIELERWEIDNDSGDSVETRTRMNEAIEWAVENGYDKIVVPPGTYLVGETTTDNYSAGIVLPENMTLELSEGAVLQMATNDRWNYCVVTAASDVTIRGGEIRGDRETHIYDSAEESGHDEGHGICVWTGIERVLIEDTELHELTGDGVLILGRKAAEGVDEEPSRQVTIRGSEIHHNRRQGVSVVGGWNVVIADNHIHHIEGTSPQFGIDIEGAGREDRDIHIFQNRFNNNAGGDIVTSTGHNVWIEENLMIQCRANEAGEFDADAPCELEEQVDGPIVLWKETDNVILNNEVRMSLSTVNGFYGIIGYTGRDGATRENPVGNYIAGNSFFGAGVHLAHNMRQVLIGNVLHESIILGFHLGCTQLHDNRINRTKSEHFKLRDVAGVATGNILNRAEGAPTEEDLLMHFPMANDAPYRNSSPVFW